MYTAQDFSVKLGKKHIQICRTNLDKFSSCNVSILPYKSRQIFRVTNNNYHILDYEEALRQEYPRT